MFKSVKWSHVTLSQFLAIPSVIVAMGFIVYSLRLSVARVLYPYDLDFVEDAILLQAYRFTQHRPVFVPPNANFVPQVYMPLYTWLGGCLFRLTGPAFWPLRLLSLLATLGTAVLIAAITVHESQAWTLATVSAGVFLAGYRLVGGWYDLARVDPLFIFLSMLGMAVAVYQYASRWGLAMAGLLMGLSFLSKQNGLFLAAVAGAFLLVVVGRQVIWYVIPFGLVTAVPILVWQWQSGGWFSTYVFGIAYASPVALERVKATLQNELWGAMGVLFLMMSVWGGLLTIKERWRVITRHPWLLFITVALFVTIAGRASIGGNLNNLMPGYAFLCLVPGLFLAELARVPEGWRKVSTAALPLLLLFQFYLTQFNPISDMPRQMWPTAEMRTAGDHLINRIAAADGEVWVMMHPFYALLADKTEPGVHIQTLWHDRWRGQNPLPADLVMRIQNQQYTMIISDESPYFETEPVLQILLETYYRRSETLSLADSAPTLSGIQVRPLVVYVPK